jgi:hypothetical protein
MVRENNTVVFAQTPLLKSRLEELKRLTGTTSTKDALQAAVNHYLNCPMITGGIEGEEWEKDRKRKELEQKEWWWSPEKVGKKG